MIFRDNSTGNENVCRVKDKTWQGYCRRKFPNTSYSPPNRRRWMQSKGSPWFHFNNRFQDCTLVCTVYPISVFPTFSVSHFYWLYLRGALWDTGV